MSKDNYTFGDLEKNGRSIHDDIMSEISGGLGSVPKAKDPLATVKKFLVYAQRDLAAVLFAAAVAVLGTALVLFTPPLLADLTDLIAEGMMTGIDLGAIRFLGITIAAIYVVSSLLMFVQGYIVANASLNISKRMRTDLAAKINRLPMWFFNKNTTGDILSRIANDVDALGQNLSHGITTLVTSLAMLVGSLIMMFSTNWILAVAAVSASLFGLLAMMLIIAVSQKHFDGQQLYLGKLNGQVEETFSGHTTVKAYNAEAQMKASFGVLNEELRKHSFMAQFLSGFMTPIMFFMDNLGYVAVSVVGAALVLNGEISFGVIVSFIVYVRYFTQPLMQVAETAQGIQIAIASGERVFELMHAEEMPDENAKTKTIFNPQGRVEFNHVRFGYENTDKIVIHDFSALALPGQKVAIVGPTGAGKTTLVNLLMRFNELSGGEISIDGIPHSQMSREEVHSLFCMVLQDTWIFEGTIRENIVYNKPYIDEDAVQSVCKAVGMHHFIKTLPKGYDTLLDDKANLSSGQKQLLTIARAMITNAPMLILDEATSSVDTRTELKVQQAMDKLMEGRTSFVIAHRLSTIKNADIILVLKNGDIVEKGRHQELLSMGGFYAELYNSQFDRAS
ncbi:MAG: putative ABC transporter ATP-binding protein [Firmicutes bacterium]|nr:putative ABC transporter ATP-binding protein [Bacillota bacterium]